MQGNRVEWIGCISKEFCLRLSLLKNKPYESETIYHQIAGSDSAGSAIGHAIGSPANNQRTYYEITAKWR